MILWFIAGLSLGFGIGCWYGYYTRIKELKNDLET